MSFVDWLSIDHTLVTLPLGSGYAMSWIEGIAALFGLLCVWYASVERTSTYAFGLINVTLSAVMFFQIQLYGLLLLQLFFFAANLYGWYAWTRPTNPYGDKLQIRWLCGQKASYIAAFCVLSIALLTRFIDPVFVALAQLSVLGLNSLGLALSLPAHSPDAFPLWDAAMTVLSIAAQILMARKFVENWFLWVLVNLISIGVYAAQGIYTMSLLYCVLLVISLNGVRLWMFAAKRPQLVMAH
ncbi:MAG: nicotinamide riboside transporter PnuC [Aeromonas sp.]